MSDKKINPKHVVITPLLMYERYGWMNYDLFLWLQSSPVDYYRRHQMNFSVCPAHNFHPAPAARNVAGKMFLETDAEWLLMIDNDMAPPDNLLDMIVNAGPDRDIIIPVMFMWDNKRGQVFLCWKPVSQYSEKGEWTLDDEQPYQELLTGGTGAIAIRRRVLENMPYPWFQYEYSENYELITSEDVWFTGRARAAVFKTWGYTKAPCGHFHSVDLLKIPPRVDPLTDEKKSKETFPLDRPHTRPEKPQT